MGTEGQHCMIGSEIWGMKRVPCSTKMGTPRAIDTGFDVCRQRSTRWKLEWGKYKRRMIDNRGTRLSVLVFLRPVK